ncbi:RNA 2',3'-cyclic phosphodiesterase [Pseudonocardia sp. KRD-184]|uniref:RNA 2',3'-cyclic phosphodiesterase n=1 Tax=Pseudonocardia oceani TaxID=2792013 RepID=A0ABS6UAN7_9PSEU|nr:RNA 2',3'-cyclic phosphodiesterase [Pseudonocardia oceani]MBW0089478.1 RNA 2',3'-cyclic phosphodiesterase [Pseudonocardia oceani]MBW0096488.1 RNA 2',3'-cyclic phosphodiesterase [Pseudonocardia oceani]MBW0109423.1 RNA 2',3'-cyclic phosphodiesterase [Pseudonocardia oceani]MBW0123331.1 RNA 2',3'-cyclic phosphodiesterase [Pseudonocardia oceani]MBW0129309.1 RNA 2',3'-cyclic phosphodiesterase [Pseudonocardia oceani]
MRSFVALLPPPDALDELAEAVAALPDEPRLRWTPPAQWHLTLAFLGEVDGPTRDRLVERLARAARRHPPVELALAGGGRFGDRVLWTRVDGDRAALRLLAGSVRAAARKVGLPVEDRPYRPHLTLARVRPPAPDLRPFAEALAGFAGRPWTATALHLVRSDLGAGPGGTARHEVVGTWELAGGRRAQERPAGAGGTSRSDPGSRPRSADPGRGRP